ncbi:translation initiation factor IF-3 [Synoicihabitans lomoniglobus]|uniref:Translation initiation factor IF-3 n=1 Tax=Synoicihabitans lomoniglobus TaxID=2909285 RepID=A0AAF0CPU0_9BACT|nr:translation initiation factor IF-3 [Opitutaceae bacterium LMO-M01]WED65822.1 translation initiation factor IF-3 [Opitutaceae bacterium LMO-M01]
MATSFSFGGGKRRGGGRNFRRNNDPYAHIRRNQRIRVPQIRVISPEGKQLGVLQTDKALSLAQQFNLDLVEVAPHASPPVCRIMDFGKYVYEEQKKSSNSKVTASKIKEVELSPRIDDHDLITKLRHAEEFLNEGSKVKLRLKFRGREMAHTEIGFQVMKRAIEEISGMGHADSEPKLNGRQINVMITPHPSNKRKLKYFTPKAKPASEPEPESKPDLSALAEGSGDDA